MIEPSLLDLQVQLVAELVVSLLALGTVFVSSLGRKVLRDMPARSARSLEVISRRRRARRMFSPS